MRKRLEKGFAQIMKKKRKKVKRGSYFYELYKEKDREIIKEINERIKKK